LVHTQDFPELSVFTVGSNTVRYVARGDPPYSLSITYRAESITPELKSTALGMTTVKCAVLSATGCLRRE
jgi:hypothetical protein